MIFQMLNWLVGTIWTWLLSYEPPHGVFSALSAGYGALSTLFAWMPRVPYIPYYVMAGGVFVLFSAWLVLVAGGLSLRLARMFHFIGDGPR